MLCDTIIKSNRGYKYFRFNCGMVYYGLSFGVQALAGNPYLNIFISGAVEAPAVLSVIYFNNWYICDYRNT